MVRRYLVFFAGLLFNSFGVAFVTKASLGTSPLAAIPYSLSIILPQLSLGNWVIVFNLALVVLQAILLRKDANKVELGLQVIITFVFGKVIDLSMLLLTHFLPQNYLLRVLSLLVGCTIIAFGAYLEVIADVVMLPGDAFVRAVAKVSGKEYGGVRVLSDVSMTAIAALLCLIFLRVLSGVREGTLIAAVITGNIVKFFVKTLQPLSKALLAER